MTRLYSASPWTLVIVGLIASMICGPSNAVADDPDEIPEIGLVDWSLDFESVKRQSKKTGRPIFLLFQEIPG